ncbi:MAG: DegV family protein [Clostridia bacterium]|nr:DegV family protein [Clostridia bacterium]
MAKFWLSTDSTCDLFVDYMDEHDIHHVPLTFMIERDGKIEEYLDEFTSYQQYVDFYNTLRSGAISRTAMLNYESHYNHFLKMAQAGAKDVVHFTISSGLSPTITVAEKAAAEVKKDYPDFTLYGVDPLTATIGQGMLVRIAMEWRDKDKSAKETYDYIMSLRTKIQHFVIADDLNYLMRGGRVSKTSAIVGGALGIKPVISFDNNGKLFVLEKCRKMRGAFRSILEKLDKIPVDRNENRLIIVHNDNEKDANELANLIEEKIGLRPEIFIMGPVIGSHVGPNAVSFGYLSTKERNDFGA